MIVAIKRSGGFAGIEQSLGVVDSSRLTREQDARMRGCVARLSDVLSKRSDEGGSDRFQYEVTVTGDDGRTKSMTVIDEGDPQDPAVRIVMELMDGVVR